MPHRRRRSVAPAALPHEAGPPQPEPEETTPIRRSRPKSNPALRSTLKLIAASLDADKAEEIVTIDLQAKSSIADAMIIATGHSQRQMNTLAEHVVERLKAKGIACGRVEGLEQGSWVLIDAGDVIVHLFKPEFRALYNLEKMWGIDLPEQVAVAV
jgi:ribosome-associated protein